MVSRAGGCTCHGYGQRVNLSNARILVIVGVLVDECNGKDGQHESADAFHETVGTCHGEVTDGQHIQLVEGTPPCHCEKEREKVFDNTHNHSLGSCHPGTDASGSVWRLALRLQ
eukprot:3422430-Amphidinium_carterae.1